MIDLHTHTKASDGENTAQELIDLAIKRGVKALAITDHDTMDAIEPAMDYARDKAILLIPGIEFDTKCESGKMHILGLFVDYTNKNLKEKLLNIKRQRDDRNTKFIEEFNKLGFDITLEELKEISDGKIIGKPHFGRIFLKKNYIGKMGEIFDKYFNQSPFKEIVKTIYTPQEVIKIIKEANGIAILAHPQTLNLNEQELRKKIIELKRYGLDGMECYHSKQTAEEMSLFKEIAEENDLLITKGSDYHGKTTGEKKDIGTGINNNIVTDIDDKIIANLIKKIKKEKILKKVLTR